MEIRRVVLGQIGGREIEDVIMDDPGRITVHIMSYGAAIRRVSLPGEAGHMQNVVLGLADPKDYTDNPLYAGAVLCPNAGRIRQGLLPLGNSTSRLTCNDCGNSLHGGYENASRQVWTIKEMVSDMDSCSVTFSVHLPDGTDGFPGNRTINICYTLRNSLCLELNFTSTTDKDTYFNLSNHTYFNMSGDFSRSGLDQELTVYAQSYIANDEEHLPKSRYSCAGTAFDFSRPASLKSNMDRYPGDRQLLNARGYNNGFILDDETPENSMKKAASLTDTASGRTMTLFTDAPCLVVYSGGYIGDSWRISSDTRIPGAVQAPGYGRTQNYAQTQDYVYSSDSCAIALEAQDVPDACHFMPECFHITKAGEIYKRRILYQF